MSSDRNLCDASGSMPLEFKPDLTDYVQCPYNRSHIILHNRISMHLIKCSRNYQEKNMLRCPFNDTHVVQSSDLQAHINNCENQKDFVRYQHPNALPRPTPPRPSTALLESTEDWSDDPPVGTYDPTVYCERNRIIRKLVGAPPSERRKFRRDEHERFKNLSNGN